MIVEQQVVMVEYVIHKFSKMKKSQSAMEFMIFMGLAILILMSYFAISHFYLDLIFKQKDVISGQDLTKQLKNEINLASRIEDNYHREFQLPNKIGDKDYTITLAGREIIVTVDGIDYVELLSVHITEQGQDPIEYNPGEIFIVEKINGKVYGEEYIFVCVEENRVCGNDGPSCENDPPCARICEFNQWTIESCEFRCETGYCQESCTMGNNGVKKCGTFGECGGSECIFQCDGASGQWSLLQSCGGSEPLCSVSQGPATCVCSEFSKMCEITPEECEGASSCVMECISETWGVTKPCEFPEVCTENPYQCSAGI